MTSNELLQIATDYQTYYSSNPDAWDDMFTDSDDAYDAFKELCTRLGVAFND